MAEASLTETESLPMVSRDLGYLGAKEVDVLLAEFAEIARMLNSPRSKVANAK
jgi:four helix bundle protein